MNRQSGILRIGILTLALTALLLGGCTSAATPTVAPAAKPTLPPSPTPGRAATATPTLTPVPTVTPTPPPTATATRTVAPTAVPTSAPTLPPTATATKSALTPAPTGGPAAPTATAGTAAPPAGSAACLACHGPYAKVVAASAGYKTSDGKSVNPHTTVDPNKPKVQAHLPGTGAPPECYMCHTPHPLVAAPQVDLSAVTLQYCFIACHHERDFKPCRECHG